VFIGLVLSSKDTADIEAGGFDGFYVRGPLIAAPFCCPKLFCLDPFDAPF
jgi:hypothetical protein